MALVAISSPYGAGGSKVAPALAERLGVPFLDRPAGTEPEHEERGGRLLSRLGSIGLAWGTPAGMELEDLVPGDARRREIEAELRALREAGGGVVLGRAAAVLLRDDPQVLRVLLTGPPERRIAQAMTIDGIDQATATRRLELTDRARMAYHQTLYCVDPRDDEALPPRDRLDRDRPRRLRRPDRRRHMITEAVDDLSDDLVELLQAAHPPADGQPARRRLRGVRRGLQAACSTRSATPPTVHRVPDEDLATARAAGRRTPAPEPARDARQRRQARPSTSTATTTSSRSATTGRATRSAASSSTAGSTAAAPPT